MQVLALACAPPPSTACPCSAGASTISPAQPALAASLPPQQDHRLALAAPRRHPPLAAPRLDLPARPRLRVQGRSHPRPLSPHLAGCSPARLRFRHLGRREDLHPGASTPASHAAPRARPAGQGRARIQTPRHLGLPRRPRCPSGQAVRPSRIEVRHCPLPETTKCAHDKRGGLHGIAVPSRTIEITILCKASGCP